MGGDNSLKMMGFPACIAFGFYLAVAISGGSN
jgi:hypothetical protein